MLLVSSGELCGFRASISSKEVWSVLPMTTLTRPLVALNTYSFLRHEKVSQAFLKR
jgi:hypothetical protein